MVDVYGIIAVYWVGGTLLLLLLLAAGALGFNAVRTGALSSAIERTATDQPG